MDVLADRRTGFTCPEHVQPHSTDIPAGAARLHRPLVCIEGPEEFDITFEFCGLKFHRLRVADLRDTHDVGRGWSCSYLLASVGVVRADVHEQQVHGAVDQPGQRSPPGSLEICWSVRPVIIAVHRSSVFWSCIADDGEVRCHLVVHLDRDCVAVRRRCEPRDRPLEQQLVADRVTGAEVDELTHGASDRRNGSTEICSSVAARSSRSATPGIPPGTSRCRCRASRRSRSVRSTEPACRRQLTEVTHRQRRENPCSSWTSSHEEALIDLL